MVVAVVWSGSYPTLLPRSGTYEPVRRWPVSRRKGGLFSFKSDYAIPDNFPQIHGISLHLIPYLHASHYEKNTSFNDRCYYIRL